MARAIDARGAPGKRILFLEDEVILSFTYATVIEELGLGEVFSAVSLEEAEEVVEKGPVDIALLDVNIHGETSFDLAKRIEQAGGRVIFATGYPLEEERSEACNVIMKPYNDEELVAALRSAAAVTQEQVA